VHPEKTITLNVLRAIASMDPSQGGPSQGIRNSIPELEKIGVHNEVVCFDEATAAFISKDKFPIHALGLGRGPSKYNPKLVPWLLENFSRFDIVIVHGLWLYHSYAIRKAIKLHKKKALADKLGNYKVPKILIMPHGMLDPYFQQAPGRKLKAIRNWGYWKLIERKVIQEADGVLFTCEEELRLARLSFRPYRPKREINVGYGVAKPEVAAAKATSAFFAKCPEVENKPYLLFLSRIHEKKGVDLLIKAYADQIHQINNTRTHTRSNSDSDKELPEVSINELPTLVIAGPGMETPYGQRIRQLATDLLGSRVYFPGMLTGEAKWGAFYGCAAFVLPSHQENFGIAVVEALACGKPVLISNQVNIWREIKATGAGLVQDNTLLGTQRLLDEWCQLPEPQKLAMAAHALAAYQRHFAIGPAAKGMADAMRNVLTH
jgi:glycosyltransferase involved in cell wall biosynthesis